MNERRNNNIRNRQNKKRAFYFRTLFLCMAVIILLLDLLFLVIPDKAVSETENRSLQMFPDLNFTTLTNGKFESRFDSYVADQFPGRDAWVRLKSSADILTGKTESNRIYLGKKGFLIQDMTIPSEEKYLEKTESIRSLKEAFPNLRFTALIAPTALSVYRDYLPANAPAADQDGFLDRLKEDISGMGVNFVDVRDALKEKAKDEQMYYRTDHHWTTAGAYAAYQELADTLDLPGKNASWTANLVTDSFSGTLAASSGFRTNATDKIYVYFPDTPVDYSVLYVEEGKKTASFYKPENLSDRDKYTVFFGGNYPEIKIETDRETKDVLLVLKDSYANCFVPFLVNDYQKIIMVDPRYYMDDLDSLIKSESVTDVLYLYNAATFAE